MDFISYQITGSNTASLNTASYLNATEYSVFIRGFSDDLWYGFSANDVIEFGVWDRQKNLIGWNVLNQSKSYTAITTSFINTLNFPVTYSYTELNTEFILYKNSKILVNPPDQLSSSFGILSGSYFLSYNFVRDMAGTSDSPLIIKDISPSRKELKLLPVSSSDSTYNAFISKRVLMRDISPLYLQTTLQCLYGQIYNQVLPLYQAQINTIKSLFFFTTDGEMLTFFKNLYEDFIVFTTVPSVSSAGVRSVNDHLVRIQGIQTYFSNYLLSNSDQIVSFFDIDNNFNAFVSASIERKFAPIGLNPPSQYVNAKAFVFDFFTKYYYQPISDTLSGTYKTKYYSPLKNAVNFGKNNLLQILDTGILDERNSPTDPITLLVKLKSELPTEISPQTQCWISNISLSPYVLNTIVKSPTQTITHKIGVPNFSVPISDISLANSNLTYTADDLKNSDSQDRELTISRNIVELNVDYSGFTNFIIFSSAEMRLKIFKNKIISISSLNDAINTLNTKNEIFVMASGSIYPFYNQEYTNIQSQIDDIVNSFDGYESYLYRSGYYDYASGSFSSLYFVTTNDLSASAYDKNNRDSLINNCPEYILTNDDYDDYIIFLSMIGHFFDNLYIYIAQLPSEKRLGNSSTEEFTRRIVDYMLQTFGWDLSDSLEQATLLNNYLNNNQIEGLNTLSAEERLKEIRNRILINLPQIYKTKGTEEAINLLLSCYGVPTSLLSIREFGGVNYNTNDAAFTTYERAFMYQWQSSSRYDQFRIPLPEGASTYLFKFVIDDASIYQYQSDQILFGSVISQSISTDISSSGQWAVGFERRRNPNAGRVFFRIGYAGHETLKIYTPDFPLFDGNIYSVMLRKNLPDQYFDFTPNVFTVPTKYDLIVQRNEFGREILRVSSSAICYNTASNLQFNGSASMLMIGGWFADINGPTFVGAFDKLQVWRDTLLDGSFEDYVNSINSYNFTGSTIPHQSLMFRMHVDYPFNVSQSGHWVNGNPFYAESSSFKFTKFLGVSDGNGGMDQLTAYNTWFGAYTASWDSPNSCSIINSPVYPWQFRIIEYPSTWGISKYGPNKFRNEKVRELTQVVASRFDDNARSTFVVKNNQSPDSNQLGLFVDPQDFKNKDIVRYFGNYDIMNAIGDPLNRFSSSYDALKSYRNIYAASKNEYSGSRTLFNELGTLYKLYFNKTIFDSIKNLSPARANTLVGMIVEPTILERPKYEARPISASSDGGGTALLNNLIRMTQSVDYGLNSDIDITYINFPSRVYPTNYAYVGNYIQDLQDKYEFGHFSGPIISSVPIISIPPSLNAICLNSSVGTQGAVYTSFLSASGGTPPYSFYLSGQFPSGLTLDSGTGIVSGIPTLVGNFAYFASVKDSRGTHTSSSCLLNIIALPVPPIITYPCGQFVTFAGGNSFPASYTMSFAGHSPDDDLSFTYDDGQLPTRFIVQYHGVPQQISINEHIMNYDGNILLDLGYVGDPAYQNDLNNALASMGINPPYPIINRFFTSNLGQRPGKYGAGTINITSREAQLWKGEAYVYVYAPMPGTQFKFSLSCPY